MGAVRDRAGTRREAGAPARPGVAPGTGGATEATRAAWRAAQAGRPRPRHFAQLKRGTDLLKALCVQEPLGESEEAGRRAFNQEQDPACTLGQSAPQKKLLEDTAERKPAASQKRRPQQRLTPAPWPWPLASRTLTDRCALLEPSAPGVGHGSSSNNTEWATA